MKQFIVPAGGGLENLRLDDVVPVQNKVYTGQKQRGFEQVEEYVFVCSSLGFDGVGRGVAFEEGEADGRHGDCLCYW